MMAVVLASTMLCSTAFSVSAAPSPDSGINVESPDKGKEVVPTPASTKPSADPSSASASAPKNVTDMNTQDYKKATVVSAVTSDSVTVKSITSSKKKASVTLKFARNGANEKVAITTIGDSKNGVFNTKKGKNVKKLTIKSSKKVVIKKKAFKGSKISTLKISGKRVQINKNAFKGTKATSLTLKIKKASLLKLKKGSLQGLSSITIKGAGKKEKAKIIKAIKKAGFKGTIK